MAPKIIAVLGATGQQGGSVVQSLLKAQDWQVRALTRDTSKASAKKLTSAGAEVVNANIDEEASLVKAFEGVHAIFAVTNFWEHMMPPASLSATKAQGVELEQGKRIAVAASKVSTLETFIWSSLPAASDMSGGKYSVPHFDGKAAVDEYIKKDLPELAAKTAYLWVGWYANNLVSFPMARPAFFEPCGKHIWVNPCSGKSIIPSAGDVTVNVGIFVQAILSNPKLALPGKYVPVDIDPYPLEQVLSSWSKVTKNAAEYVEVSPEVFDALYPGGFGAEMARQLKWGEEYGDWFSFKKGGELVKAEQLGIKKEQLVDTEACFAKLFT